MSIRRRLLLVLVLSGAVVTGAVYAVFRLWASSDAARIEEAETALRDVAEAVAADVAARGDEEPRRALERSVAAALAGARRGMAGLCDGSGTAMARRPRGRQDLARPVQLPPEHAAAVDAACASERSKTVPRVGRMRGETLVIAVATSGGTRAWAAMPVQTREGIPMPWKVGGAALALATIALVAIAIDAMMALRRGAEDLDRSLEALGGDLGAKVEIPRAEELAGIAEGLRRMAQRLSEANARERDLSQSLAHEQRLAALGRVAAGVAHEVRNPLAGMKLRLDLMKRTAGLPTEVGEDVDACLGEIARLDRLVRTILGAARREPQIRSEVALGALIDGRAYGDRVVREGDATVATDPDLLAQIVDNLVRNALEASAGEVRIEIAERATGGGRAAVEVAVVDDGPGVPPERAAELFEPFFTTRSEGTGLGLFISRSLARALGGTLDYHRDGDRTRFSLILPR
ncbi:MAG: HAMP domain-containing histidine kinase [Deltaproteobacteria bacterium]|nr:HAMP domain-containing histidine kinase [Deltaproteobacteria bacterium]